MNYDIYGFPIFDDKYISDVAKMNVEEKKKFLNENYGVDVPKELLEFCENNQVEIIKEMTGIPAKESKIHSLF